MATRPCSSACARRQTRSPRPKRWRRRAPRPTAVRRPGGGQGQHRRRGPADHRRLSGLCLHAGQDATAVARLEAAGAIVIGKTNLDQFATGLVGVRSPYGVPRNPFDPALIPGGSSSGSAVAVAAGLVPLALGTDTAGSGRVPAAFNNIVGLKPSLGLVSTAGVVPACRSLDCVSIFALTTDDAWTALDAIAGADRGRSLFARAPARPARLVRQRNRASACRSRASASSSATGLGHGLRAAIERAAALGAQIAEIDIEPFYESGAAAL